MMAPRRVVIVLQAETLLVPKRESEAATRALDAARGAAQAARAADDAGARRGAASTSAAGCSSCSQKHATIVECGVARGSGRRRALGADPRRGGRRRRSSPAGGAAARRSARGTGRQAAARRRRSAAAVRARAEDRSRVDDVREVAGPAALQDDWAMTNAIEAGQAAEALRQLALMLDAGAPPEKILGQLGWLVRAKFPALAPATSAAGGRGAVPDRPRPQAVGRRPARPARAAGRRIVRGEAGAAAWTLGW